MYGDVMYKRTKVRKERGGLENVNSHQIRVK